MSRVITADAFDALADLDAESVHAVVTDPPYALGDGFMGEEWDSFSDSKTYQKWCEKWARECLRVLKPGGHLLAFGGNTRHHRLNVGVEDAGFEIRDQLTYHFGSGFPKSLDVSKAIDKAAGAEREVLGENPNNRDRETHDYHSVGNVGSEAMITEPATDAAREWDGFKTALKPATEFIVLARKPFEGTVAENVQAHGTGALNIDGCRIETGEDLTRPNRAFSSSNDYAYTEEDHSSELEQHGSTKGRYPANVIFDAEAAERLDREVGETSTPAGSANDGSVGEPIDSKVYGGGSDRTSNAAFVGDSGGPSRFYYTSKATRAERTLDGKIENAHPTVKPIDLMEWLVRLVTAEGQHVLDPFAGTGTTGRAAKNLGREFTLIERDPKWADVARARCGLTPDDPSRFTPDGQTTLTGD